MNEIDRLYVVLNFRICVQSNRNNVLIQKYPSLVLSNTITSYYTCDA